MQVKRKVRTNFYHKITYIQYFMINIISHNITIKIVKCEQFVL